MRGHGPRISIEWIGWPKAYRELELNLGAGTGNLQAGRICEATPCEEASTVRGSAASPLADSSYSIESRHESGGMADQAGRALH